MKTFEMSNKKHNFSLGTRFAFKGVVERNNGGTIGTRNDPYKSKAHEAKKKNLNSIGVRDGVGGQGQYWLGRGSIGWARVVSAVPLPKSDFQHIKKSFLRCFFGWLGPKN